MDDYTKRKLKLDDYETRKAKGGNQMKLLSSKKLTIIDCDECGFQFPAYLEDKSDSCKCPNCSEVACRGCGGTGGSCNCGTTEVTR